MWKVIKEIFFFNYNEINVVFGYGKLQIDFKGIVEILNNYFLSIGKSFVKVFCGLKLIQYDVVFILLFFFKYVMLVFVEKQLCLMKINKVVGLDSISVCLFCDVVNVFVLFLWDIINFFFEKG